MLHFCIDKCCQQNALFCFRCQSDRHFLHNTHRLELLLTSETTNRDDSVHWNTLVTRLSELADQAYQLEVSNQQMRSLLDDLLETARQKQQQRRNSNSWQRDLLQSFELFTNKEISLDQASKKFRQAARSIDIHDQSDFFFPQWSQCQQTRSIIYETLYTIDSLRDGLDSLICNPSSQDINRKKTFLTRLSTGRDDYGRTVKEILEHNYGNEFAEKQLLGMNHYNKIVKDFERLVETAPNSIRTLTLTLEDDRAYSYRQDEQSIRKVRTFFSQLLQFKGLKHLIVKRNGTSMQVQFLRLLREELLRNALVCNLKQIEVDQSLKTQMLQIGSGFRPFNQLSKQHRSALMQAHALEKCTFIRNCPLIYKQEILQVCQGWDSNEK